MTLNERTVGVLKALDDLLLETSGEERILIQTELGKKIPEITRSSDPQTEGTVGFKFKPDLKLRSFKKGENFARFCERFKQYIAITKMEDNQLNLLFLQNVDEETYAKLSSIRLKDSEKCNSQIFCEIYKAVIYGQECTVLKNEVLECKQLENESIDDYAFRLKEKAFIAFPDEIEAEQSSTLTFYRGVKNLYIKRRLNEKSFTNLEEAVLYAKRLEKVEEMVNDKPDVTSILKESNVTFEPSNSGLNEEDDSKLSESSRNRGRNRSFERQSRPRDRRYDSRSSTSSRSPSRTRSFERQNRSRDTHHRNRSFNSRSPGRWNGSRSKPRHNNYQNDKWSNNRSNKSKTNAKCWNCNRKGHMQRDCWFLKNNSNGGNKPSASKSNLN